MIINHVQYELLAGIKLGKREMDPLFAALIEWIRHSFGIRVIYFLSEERNQTERHMILRMFLETMQDVQALAVDAQNGHIRFKYSDEILDKLKHLVGEYKRENEFYLEDIHFIVWNFDDLAKESAYGKAAQEIEEHIKKNYADAPIHYVYTMFSLAVFYHTDEQLHECQRNGISARIKADYYYYLKKHDDFDLFTPDNFECIFDSHENVEKNFQGNYYFYFK